MGIGINGGGKSDLVFQNSASNQVAAWLMDEANIASASAITRADAPAGWKYKASGDLNADGNADLLFQNKFSGAVAVWAMNCTDALATAVLAIAPGPEWQLIDSGDLKGTAGPISCSRTAPTTWSPPG